jgi:hypothetical protein
VGCESVSEEVGQRVDSSIGIVSVRVGSSEDQVSERVGSNQDMLCFKMDAASEKIYGKGCDTEIPLDTIFSAQIKA